MKRVNNLYAKFCSRENIELAFKNAINHKRNRGYVQRIMKNKYFYLDQVETILNSRNIWFTKPIEKTIFDRSSQKERNIKIPKLFPDQIIHWCLMQVIQPIVSRGMYKYCCGSVPKRGGHGAKVYIEKCLKDKSIKYVAKMDISKFFQNVDNDTLFAMFKRKIKDKEILNVIKKILDNGGKGLPIGYYTSQWFSNFYLEGLDHFIKEKLQIKYYVRYVDDIVLLDTDKNKLHNAIKEIIEYLKTIKLKIKGNYQVWKTDSRPIDFVGYKFFTNKIFCRRRIFTRFLRRIRRLKTYITIKQARGLLSLIGFLVIKDKYSTLKQKLTNIVSMFDKRKLLLNS